MAKHFTNDRIPMFQVTSSPRRRLSRQVVGDRADAAFNMVDTIAALKGLIVALQVFGAVVMFSEELVPAGLVALLSAFVTWVFFGWAQHSLAMLASIARNTGRGTSG